MGHQNVIGVVYGFDHAVPDIDEVGEASGGSVGPAVFLVGFQVVAQEHQITNDPIVAFLGVDRDGNVARAVPRGGDDGDAVKDFLLAGDEFKITAVEGRGEAGVGVFVRAPVGGDGVEGEGMLDVAGVVFRFFEFFHVVAVVPMQVGENDGFNIVCAEAHLRDLLVDGRARVLAAVMMEVFGDFCAAHAGVDQVFMSAAFQQPGEYRVLEDGAQTITEGGIQSFVQVLPAGEDGLDGVGGFHGFTP